MLVKPFKITLPNGRKSKSYYGKVNEGGQWSPKIKLYADKAASLRKLTDLQRIADQRAAGILTPDIERLSLPMPELVKHYLTGLRHRSSNTDNVRITEWMLNKLVERGRWKYFNAITTNAMLELLKTMEQEGLTVSYRNKFIKQAKSFVKYLLPTGMPNPLEKLSRIKERGAKQTRGRRAASAEQLITLLSLPIPDDRRLAYALAGLNGFRRNEAAGLTWDRLHLDAPIPFVELEQKQGSGHTLDSIPLHPFVIALLQERTRGFPGVKVLKAVPDIKTVKKDWAKAGVEFIDNQGKRLDYHALRHTFSTHLDQSGASRATKKKLMRHAAEDITDGYTHAELAEMRLALDRLNASQPQRQSAAATGTDGQMQPAQPQMQVDHIVDQAMVFQGHSLSFIRKIGKLSEENEPALKKRSVDRKPLENKELISLLLSDGKTPAIIPIRWPSTQAV